MLFECLNMVYGALLIQFHQTAINEVLDLTFQVNLCSEPLLKLRNLLLHRIILSDLGVNLRLLNYFHFLLLLDLFRGSSSFRSWLQHVV
jgi:hypothetical protein